MQQISQEGKIGNLPQGISGSNFLLSIVLFISWVHCLDFVVNLFHPRKWCCYLRGYFNSSVSKEDWVMPENAKCFFFQSCGI